MSWSYLSAFRVLAVLLALGCAAPLCFAQEAKGPPTAESVKADLDSKALDLDTVWTLVAAFLVMWMQAGFAAVETGFTRAKNAVHICMKNLLDYSFGSIAFWAVGFGLMFSIGSGPLENFIGSSGFFLSETEVKLAQDDGTVKDTTNFEPIAWTNVPLETKFFFQLVFAATAATIVSGAMAERTAFGAYLVYSVFISLLIYPISGHWIWGGGWLADRGFFDFAGSTVVHSVGGWVALAGAFLVGARLGKYGPDGKPRAIPGHNIPLATLGVFILWLGWFGFNPGSTMGAARMDISHIVVTTNTAAAAGAVVALLVSKVFLKTWDAGMALNGVLAGLVAITAPCPWVTVGGSLAIGAIAGALVVGAIIFFDRVAKIDDPVGAISVHGVNGAWGTLAVGLFAAPAFVKEGTPKLGLLYGGGAEQLLIQLTGVVAVFAWCMLTGFALFLAIKYTVGLRVSAEEEVQGLDIGEHAYEAYHGFVLASEPAYASNGVHEPRPAMFPADGLQRFTLVVDGVPPDALSKAWSELCQPSGQKSAEFLAVYPYFTTMTGNRFRFRASQPEKVRASVERLLQERLRSPVTVTVE